MKGEILDIETVEELAENKKEIERLKRDKNLKELENKELIKKVAKQDMENYAILVHAMKSDSKYLGFKKLAELAYEHELASKANNVDEVNDKFENLKKEAERITHLAKEYLK